MRGIRGGYDACYLKYKESNGIKGYVKNGIPNISLCIEYPNPTYLMPLVCSKWQQSLPFSSVTGCASHLSKVKPKISANARRESMREEKIGDVKKKNIM